MHQREVGTPHLFLTDGLMYNSAGRVIGAHVVEMAILATVWSDGFKFLQVSG